MNGICVLWNVCLIEAVVQMAGSDWSTQEMCRLKSAK
jgi:hypothetical protein